MKRIFRTFGKHSARAIAPLLLLALLNSTTGCSRRYVVVDANKPATNITQGEVDRLYQDNELLQKALAECGSAR